MEYYNVIGLLTLGAALVLMAKFRYKKWRHMDRRTNDFVREYISFPLFEKAFNSIKN